MTIYIGLIGGGNITETHARAARAIPGVEIAAIFGENVKNVERLCREHGGVSYSDFSRFLVHRPMDFVVIGSPSGLHAGQGSEAVRRGLPVLTEKPIDISTARADALIADAEQFEVKIGVFFQDRVKPGILRLRQLLQCGQLGEVILADARVKWYRPPEYYQGSRWRGKLALDGGGALINQGIHTVDLLIFLLGDIVAVQAKMTTALHTIESEDTLVALLEFANGAMGTLVATTSAYPGYPRRLELSCSEGTVVLEHDRIVLADLRQPMPELLGNEEGDLNASAASPVVSDVRGHQALLEDFIRAVQTGSDPICDGREGRRSLAVVEAIYEASRTRKRVAVPRGNDSARIRNQSA
jgi:UDP-N-acetyl-2-amino-2-deoxyglucuronate dehydrogenase